MALISKQRTPKGYAEFWVIGRLDIDNFSKVATVKLHGFPDKSFADEMGAVPMESVEITIYPDLFEKYFSDGSFIENAYRLFMSSVIEGATTYDFTQAKRG